MNNESKWTHEPWWVEQTDTHNWVGIARADGKIGQIVFSTDRHPSLRPEIRERADADAQRIVECVNAFRGVSNPAAFMKAANELGLHSDCEVPGAILLERGVKWTDRRALVVSENPYVGTERVVRNIWTAVTILAALIAAWGVIVIAGLNELKKTAP